MEARLSAQRQDSQLRQHADTCQRKEGDFSLAIQARDGALREVEKLQTQIGANQEREKQKVGVHKL